MIEPVCEAMGMSLKLFDMNQHVLFSHGHLWINMFYLAMDIWQLRSQWLGKRPRTWFHMRKDLVHMPWFYIHLYIYIYIYIYIHTNPYGPYWSLLILPHHSPKNQVVFWEKTVQYKTHGKQRKDILSHNFISCCLHMVKHPHQSPSTCPSVLQWHSGIVCASSNHTWKPQPSQGPGRPQPPSS